MTKIINGASFKFKDISTSLHNDKLTIANSTITRVLDISSGLPRSISLKNNSGDEFASIDKIESDFSFMGIHFTAEHLHNFYIESITAEAFPESLFDSEHVKICLNIKESVQCVDLQREYIIYPELSAIATLSRIISAVTPIIYWTPRGGDLYKCNENTANIFIGYKKALTPFLESCVDSIKLNAEIKPVLVVEFFGRTDYSAVRVTEHIADKIELNGNLLYCEAAGKGLFFLQEAPPSNERRDLEKHDFRISDNTVFSCNWGIQPGELHEKKQFCSYRNVLVVYNNDAEKNSLLKKYLKKRFPQNSSTSYSVMVNPWGQKGFPELLNEQFLIDEVTAAAQTGATHYQIDDGWQCGGSLSELSMRNRAIKCKDFWRFSDKFPNGFDNVAAAAHKNGIALGLWIAPSGNCEYRDWKEFSDVILNLYRRYKIRVFKIDAIMLRTYEAEKNLELLFKTVRKKSNGEIIFNIDVTNGQRFGYFMLLEYGNIFLQNRSVYTGYGYHPEETLRSLWNLAKYIRPQVLQIEVPCPDSVDPEFYTKINRTLPTRYPLEYWAAIPMFANPLLWFAPSKIDQHNLRRYKRIMDIHLTHKAEFMIGEIYPVGEEPSGCSICGFQSHNEKTGSGFLIYFREADCRDYRKTLKINFLPEAVEWDLIINNTESYIKQDLRNAVEVKLKDKSSFALYRYRAVKN